MILITALRFYGLFQVVCHFNNVGPLHFTRHTFLWLVSQQRKHIIPQICLVWFNAIVYHQQSEPLDQWFWRRDRKYFNISFKESFYFINYTLQLMFLKSTGESGVKTVLMLQQVAYYRTCIFLPIFMYCIYYLIIIKKQLENYY